MPIPSRGIGWSTQDNLLWQIAKQMEQTGCQLCELNDNIQTITGTSGTSGSSGISGTSGSSGTSGVNLYYGSFIFDSETALTSAIPNPSSTAAIQVTSTAGFSSSGYIKIDAEIIQYTGTTATSFTGITRGIATSSASSHSIGSNVTQAQWSPALTPAQVILDVTDLSNGVTLSGVGDITIANAGIYNIQFSIQFQNFGNDYADAAVWFNVNGSAVPKSASHTTISQSHSSSPGSIIMTVNIFYTFGAGDVVSLWWRNVRGLATITSIASEGATVPQSPGVILTVNKIS